MKPAPIVLYEDNHLLVLNKPPNLPTMGVGAEASSLFFWARDYIRQKYHKPGNVYLGVVSRLDALASGVIVLARTSKAAARLTEQFRSGAVDKTYWALVSPSPSEREAEWTDFVRKDEKLQRMVTVAPNAAGAQVARLHYVSRGQWQQIAWLEVHLETGRKHQIRVQSASRGCPILGDRKYGSPHSFPGGIALHSQALVLTHPTRRERMEFKASPPSTWSDYTVRLGFEL